MCCYSGTTFDVRDEAFIKTLRNIGTLIFVSSLKSLSCQAPFFPGNLEVFLSSRMRALMRTELLRVVVTGLRCSKKPTV